MRANDRPAAEDGLMTWDDTFRFRCGPGIECFNSCCRDVTIFLNPLDVGRMSRALGLSSTVFLGRYTTRLAAESTGVPAVVLNMQGDGKTCPFVTEKGCKIYEARPYSCRLYPLDTENGIEYTFITDSETCLGLKDSREWTVETWRLDQGLVFYDDMDHQLKDVMKSEEVWEAPIRDPRMQDMIYMALYDPDRFREFVFESTFLQKFDIDEDILEKIREDDVALLYFAAEWLRFALFGKRAFLKFDKEFLERKKKEVLQKKRS